MTAKNENPFGFIKKENTNSLIKVYFQISRMKQILRQGWLRHIGKEKCESVADHSFGTAILSMLVARKYFPQLDSGKIVKMSIIHDLGEIYAGDITPFDGISKKKKHEAEKEGINKLFLDLPDKEFYLQLWNEYETGETKEAKFVKQIDKLEMALQARVYALEYNEDMEEYIKSAREKIKDPELLEIIDSLEDLK